MRFAYTHEKVKIRATLGEKPKRKEKGLVCDICLCGVDAGGGLTTLDGRPFEHVRDFEGEKMFRTRK